MLQISAIDESSRFADSAHESLFMSDEMNGVLSCVVNLMTLRKPIKSGGKLCSIKNYAMKPDIALQYGGST